MTEKTNTTFMDDLPGAPMDEHLNATYYIDPETPDNSFGRIGSVSSLEFGTLPGFNPLTGDQLVADILGIMNEKGKRDWFVKTVDGKELTFTQYGDLLKTLGAVSVSDNENEETKSEPASSFSWDDLKNGKAEDLDKTLSPRIKGAMEVAQAQGFDALLSTGVARGVITAVDKIIENGVAARTPRHKLKHAFVRTFHPDAFSGQGIDPDELRFRFQLAETVFNNSQRVKDLQ